MQMVNTVEETEKGRRLPGVKECGGWADGGSWWPFSVSGDRWWFLCDCSSSLGAETQRLCWRSRRWLHWWRRLSSFLCAFLPLCFCPFSFFFYFRFRSSPSLFYFVFFFVFSIRFCFSPLCHYSSPLFFLLSLPFFFDLVSLYNLTSLSSLFCFFLPVSVSLFCILSPIFFLFSSRSIFRSFSSPLASKFPSLFCLSPSFSSFYVFCFYFCLSPPP